jgi:uncharacterized membrane protein
MMDKLAFAMVTVSVFSHAYWNYLLKISNRKHIFIALSKIGAVVMFGIPAIFGGSVFVLPGTSYLLVLIAAILTGLNYFFVARAYEHGQLSLMYPVSRCAILFLPFLAFLVIDESIGMAGWLAVATILAGNIVMHIDKFSFSGVSQLGKKFGSRGTAYALLAALMLAGYTIAGKAAVEHIEPFIYFLSYTLLTAVAYTTLCFASYSRADITAEWKENWKKIIQVGFLDGCTFLLVLFALHLAKASHVGGLRQLGLVVGVFFGNRFLKEETSAVRVAGAIISICGGLIFLFEG